MAGTFSHQIISLKVDFLVENRNYIQTVVNETNKVIQLASSWLRNEETTNNLTYTDINKMIESKLDILVSTDFTVGCEETTTVQESVAARSFPPPSTSTDQPLPAGYGNVSGVPVASDEIKTVLSQVNVMQDAMSFLSSSSKNLSEKQLEMEKLVESLSEKYSKMEQEKVKEIETELEPIRKRQKKASLHQDKRMTSLEKKIQEVTDSESDIIENCHQQQSKIREHKEENEKLKTQSQEFTKDLNDVLENIQELNTRINVLENTSVNGTHLEGSIGSLEGRLENLSLRLEEQDSSLKDLIRREEESLRVKKCELEKLEKFEEMLSALVNSCKKPSVDTEKSSRDVETKLNSVCDQMDVFQSKFTQIEQQTQQQAIGFSAKLMLVREDEDAPTFTSETINNVNYYNPTTFEFTAPLDGLYATLLSLQTSGNSYLSIAVAKRPCVCNDWCNKCYIIGHEIFDSITESSFRLLEMKAGDRIVVLCNYGEGHIELFGSSSFSCFKIC